MTSVLLEAEVISSKTTEDEGPVDPPWLTKILKVGKYLPFTEEQIRTGAKFVVENQGQVMVGISVGGVLLLFLLGSKLVVDAVILASLTMVGGTLLFCRLPEKLKGWIMKWSVFLDVAAAVFTFLLFGHTVTALIAAALVHFMTSSLLYVVR